PASSVDAERAFSGGRLQINHLQHNISSNSFRAKMAVGSWATTSLLPDLSELTAYIKRGPKGKGKAESDVDCSEVDE
ncbi:hypothetical protein BD410DRAFT_733451, partial [Rickenella mellea]